MHWPRPPWWSWLVALALALPAALALWFYSSPDWRRIEALATRTGVSLTAPPDRPAPNLAAFARARALEATAKSIINAYIDPAQLPTAQQLDEWTKTLALHAAAVTQLENGCDALPTTPFSDDARPWGGGWWRRSVYPPLLARVATCPPEELRTCIRRLQRVAGSGLGPDTTSLNWLLAGCACRLRELHGDAEIADALQAHIAGCIAHRTASAESMTALTAWLLRDQTSPQRAMRELGMPLSDWEEWAPFLALEVRSRREGIVRPWIEFVVSLRAHPDPATWPWVYLKGPPIDSSSGLTELRCRPGSLRSTARMLLRANVVLAELRGAPWPRDWFDSSRSPVRRIERDGRLIGAYSVGDDGVDDGGSRSTDLCWPLYETLGSPLANAPLPADKPAGPLRPPRPAPAPSLRQ